MLTITVMWNTLREENEEVIEDENGTGKKKLIKLKRNKNGLFGIKIDISNQHLWTFKLIKFLGLFDHLEHFIRFILFQLNGKFQLICDGCAH